MRFDVKTYGDPVLRRKAAPVTVFDDGLRRTAREMVRTMRAANGVGLAAEQVGLTIALFVIDIPPDSDTDEEGGPRLNPGVSMPLALANPEITAREGSVCAEEGCLSFPGIAGPVTRAESVTVAYRDLDGLPQRVTLRGLAARAAQHELDHLRGVLLIDHFSTARKLGLALALKRLKKQTQEAPAVPPAN